jgi:hypothetical protein
MIDTTHIPDESTETREKFIHQWENGLRIKHIAHSLCFARYNSLDRIIGLTAAVLSAFVSTAIIVSFTKSSNDTLKIVAGSLSALAALFAAANTFLKLGELAAKHSRAMASFGQLRRKLEFSESLEKDVNKEFLRKLLAEWGNLEKTSPAIPNATYNKARNMAKIPA